MVQANPSRRYVRGTSLSGTPTLAYAHDNCFLDRGRVQSVVVNALATAGEPVDTEGLVVNWQWESSGTDGSRNHCFGQLYPTGTSKTFCQHSSPELTFDAGTADSFVGVLTVITIVSHRLGRPEADIAILPGHHTLDPIGGAVYTAREATRARCYQFGTLAGIFSGCGVCRSAEGNIPHSVLTDHVHFLARASVGTS